MVARQAAGVRPIPRRYPRADHLHRGREGGDGTDHRLPHRALPRSLRHHPLLRLFRGVPLSRGRRGHDTGYGASGRNNASLSTALYAGAPVPRPTAALCDLSLSTASTSTPGLLQ